MIKLQNIEKRYMTKAGFTYVLRQINLDIPEGEFVTIMGPSGAGKSTLLGILGMYDHSWEGEFEFMETAVHRLSAKERSKLNKRFVGFVFQQFHLLDDLTVAENLDLPLSYRDIPKSERQGLVADLLDRFNIVARKICSPISFPEASSNWLLWRARSSRNRNCFWPMSQLATSIRIRAARS
jgi:ABC-type lipoprotein export system ATPase subunit